MAVDGGVVHHVLWTGGWDSTYRVADLVLVHGRTAQPWYVVEPGRTTTARELATMSRIRRRIVELDPAAADRLRPPVVRHVTDIRSDPGHVASAQVVGAREPITSQQSFLPVLVRQEGLGAMETGITADDHMEGPFALVTVARSPAPPPDDWWYLTREGSDPDDFSIWGDYRMPLLDVTKLQMASAAQRHGFRDVMEMTWFCRWPTVLGNPCGFCVPCNVTRSAGLLWRVPEVTATRRRLHSAKWAARRRIEVLRANASLSGTRFDHRSGASAGGQATGGSP